MTMIECIACATPTDENDTVLFDGVGIDGMVCVDCQSSLLFDIDNLSSCNNCSQTIATYGDVIESGAISHTFTYDDVSFSIGDQTFDITMGDCHSDADGDTFYLCDSCRDDYSSCCSCDAMVPDSQIEYCDSCEEYYCRNYGCTSAHDECGSSYESASGMSIDEALNRPAEPGSIIRSLRAVGCEIERSTGDSRSAAQEMMSAGFLYESHSEHCGHEYVLLPARGANLETAIRGSFDILARNNALGNNDCGAHFHLDMSTLSRPEIFRGLAALRIVENVLFAGTGDVGNVGARRSASWCVPTATSWGIGIPAVLALSEQQDPARRIGRISDSVRQNSRYSSINTQAYNEHRTVEIRLMDGVLDAERYLIVIGIALAAFDYGIASTSGTLRALIDNPLSLLWRAAQRGFVSGPAMEYLTDRYGVISGDIREDSALANEERNLTDRANEIAQRTRAIRDAATAAYTIATESAQRRQDAEINAARTMVQAAYAAYQAAQEAQYRIETMARAAFNADPTVSAALQTQQDAITEAINAQSNEMNDVYQAQRDLNNRRAALNARRSERARAAREAARANRSTAYACCEDCG